MWQSLAENSALLLSLAISAYTVYSFVETRLQQRRQRYALLRSLRLQAEYFIALAGSLSKRAEQVVALYAPAAPGEAYPSPAAEVDSLPEAAEPTALWLVSRAEHLLSYPITVDMEKFGSLLDQRQIEALLAFLSAHRVYTQVLATRAVDLKLYPRRKGVLRRFAGVAVLNVGAVNQQLNTFGETLGIPEMVSKAPD